MKHQIVIISILFIQSIFVSGQTNSLEQQSYSKIDSLFNSHYKSNTTGAAFTIIKDGETTYKKFKGLANVEYHLPITDSTVFNIASISKQFTTYLALLLEQEGKLSFSDDIKTYLPELNHLPNKITIKDLTTHTHGLPNTDELAYLKGILPNGKMTHQQVVRMLLNIKQTNFKVGDKYEYNNTGYILLSEIIERIEKKPFKDQLQQRIFAPLGMNHSKAIDDINIVVPNKAYSYQLINNTYKNYPVKLSTIGSSGINTTINDMIIWAKNYQNPIIGSRSFYNKMEQATLLNSGKIINYGLGLQFDSYKGVEIVFHGGGTAAYRSYILHVPKHKLSIIILANTNDFSALDLVYRTIDILLKDYTIEASKKVTIPSIKQLKKYEGTYEFQPGVYFNIIAEKDTLYFQEFGSKTKSPLPSLDKNTFEFPYIPYSKFIFSDNKFDFRIADFTYECFKTKIQQPKLDEIDLTNLTGVFINKEHNIIYELFIVENKLNLKRTFGNTIILNPLTLKSFYSSELGKLDFTYNEKGLVEGFKLSGQNFKNIIFKK
ncbi:serine hydrolase domain-containing protein [Lutibacter citreus]|uniref:serine hydrolase domain-containing protein n=1 Tax=Lutibacter citreus TaxID=2138210 RepID=UPI0013002D9E|nr:serine hydrolase domain-containing protein [Lutibacter citreus]